MLRDRGARSRGDDRRCGRDVEGAGAVAAGPAGVDERLPDRGNGRRPGPHDARGSRDFLGRLAFRGEGCEERGDHGRGDVPVHDPREQRLGLRRAEVDPRRDGLEARHGIARADPGIPLHGRTAPARRAAPSSGARIPNRWAAAGYTRKNRTATGSIGRPANVAVECRVQQT